MLTFTALLMRTDPTGPAGPQRLRRLQVSLCSPGIEDVVNEH